MAQILLYKWVAKQPYRSMPTLSEAIDNYYLHKNISKKKSSWCRMTQCMNALADRVHKQEVPCTQWYALHNMTTFTVSAH